MKSAVFFVVYIICLRISLTAGDCPVYLADEKDLIVMDMEQRGPGGGWEFSNEVPGALGSGYLVYKPLSSFGGTEWKPANFFDERIKTYHFTITTPGIYRIVLRSSAPHPTEHNDLWMSLPESGAQMTKNGTVFIPISSPLTEEQIAKDSVDYSQWFKVFQNAGNNVWNNGGVTKDFDGHVILTNPLIPLKWYSVRIAGRSTQFKVDRISVVRCEAAECAYHGPRFSLAAQYMGRQSECGGFEPPEPEPETSSEPPAALTP